MSERFDETMSFLDEACERLLTFHDEHAPEPRPVDRTSITRWVRLRQALRAGMDAADALAAADAAGGSASTT